eukprot:tig00020553_g10600.t1
MELEIGRVCAQCASTDFLPAVCTRCSKAFCGPCRHPRDIAGDGAGHDCVAVGHTSSEPSQAIYRTGCAVQQCAEKLIGGVVCGGCKQALCLKHRHPEDHACPARAAPRARRQLPKEKKLVAEALAKLSRAKSTNPTAAKVALMRLKSFAVPLGSVPPEERFYLEVYYPDAASKGEAKDGGVAGYSKHPKGVYVSRAWKIGKVVDALAEMLKLANNNNQISAPVSCALLACQAPTPLWIIPKSSLS